jgi:TetR/AcrR family transcriptional repressor of lmrAB and yxaGH operons
MAKPPTTRERMVRTAADLFQRQGYHGTGLNQVLAESSAPKGSMYFHFPDGKEQLAVEAVELSGRELGVAIAEAVASASDAEAAITRVGELLAAGLEASDYRAGCPVATVALEAAADSEPIRAACDTVYADWRTGLVRYLAGCGLPEATAGPLADLVLSALQGALLHARVQHDAAVVRSVARQVAAVVAGTLQGCGDAPATKEAG